MKTNWKSCFRVGLTAFLLYLCIAYWKPFAGLVGTLIGAATPLLLGCVLAYIFNILMSFYENHYFPRSTKSKAIKSRRPICMLAAFISLMIVLVLLIKLVVPELIACVELLLSQIPGSVISALEWLRSMDILPEDMLTSLQSIDWKSKLEQFLRILTTGIGNVMGTTIQMVSTVFSGLVTALFSLIFSIYLLVSKEKLSRQFNNLMYCYLKEKAYSGIRYFLCVLNDCFHKYIVGQCTEALILGALCTAGMLLFGFPYATMTGAVIAFTALIPVAGGYIGAAIGAFMILTVSPLQALLFLVYIVVLQQLENNLIYPRVVGSSMGLPAIWVLAAVTIGGGVMGITGMLIGVPVASALYRLLREDMKKRLAMKEAIHE